MAAAMLSDSWEMRSGITKLVQGDSSDGLDQLESLWDEPLTKIIKGTTDVCFSISRPLTDLADW